MTWNLHVPVLSGRFLYLQIICSLPNTVAAGVRTVNVAVSGLGYASGAVSATVQVSLPGRISG